MNLQLMELSKPAGTLNDVIHSELSPREFGRVHLLQHPERIIVDSQGVPFKMNLARIRSVNTVIFEGVSQVIGTCKIVDGHHIEVPVALCNPCNHSTNATKPIDSNSWHLHHNILLSGSLRYILLLPLMANGIEGSSNPPSRREPLSH